MLLYRTTTGPVLATEKGCFAIAGISWTALFNHEDLPRFLESVAAGGSCVPAPSDDTILAPLDTQEVWAAGVTYFRSRTARMEESKDAGGGSFYDRVYSAERPEIFFKATAQRVVGPGGTMHLRSDSRWMVPEPELTLAINSRGQIIGCTIGNDLSCRDIEGENPLYLPQAKCFRGCAALGPAILVHDAPLPPATPIACEISRAGAQVFRGETTLAQLKRTPAELAGFLFRDNDFRDGAFLMTGTGIVPPDDFTLQPGDEVRISIEGIGVLRNTMAGDRASSSQLLV
jgi:2-dehydro-3-deoxy-D-arabinonate dehydratase